MTRFFPGDEVIVNGVQATIRSWPADDEGPFNYEIGAPLGGRISSVGWAKPDQAVDPIHVEPDVRLVRRAEAPAATHDLAEALWLASLGNEPEPVALPDHDHDLDAYDLDNFPEATDLVVTIPAEDYDQWLAFIGRNE